MRGIGTVGASRAAPGKAGRAGRSGFSLGQVGAGQGQAASETAASTSLAGVGLGLLAVQSGYDEGERDAAARRRAESLLEDLAGLQAELLGGAPDPERLARLASLAASGEAGADPGLRELVEAIALRAQVELARRGG
jgi:Class II flagellar assembly regulator